MCCVRIVDGGRLSMGHGGNAARAARSYRSVQVSTLLILYRQATYGDGQRPL